MLIQFCDWRLVPLDRLNWELHHRHANTRGKHEGEVKWHPCGKYYQWNTVCNALAYAVDCELRDGRVDEAASIEDALAEMKLLQDGFLQDVKRVLDAHRADGEPTEGSE